MGELAGFLHTRLANLAVLAGDLAHATASVACARRLATELGADFIAAHADNAAAFAAMRTGDLVEAERCRRPGIGRLAARS